jgi:hypothetical protein
MSDAPARTRFHSVDDVRHIPATVTAFLAEKDGQDGCWVWPGRINRGYGAVHVTWADGREGTTRPHRIAYALLVGPIPTGMTIDHLCRVRACCNPDHLEVTSAGENTARGAGKIARAVRARRESGSCLRGHDASVGQDSSGYCVECGRERSRSNHDLYRQARTKLGMTHREYAATYGLSREAAERALREEGQ